MSVKNIQQLKNIANLLRSKLNFIKNNVENSKKPAIQVAQEAYDINSDSQIQALQLFDSVRPQAQTKSKKKQNGNQVKENQNNIKSILKLKGQEKKEENSIKDESEEMISEKEQEEQKEDKKSKSVSFNFDQNLIFSLNPDRKWNEKIQNQKKGKFELNEQRALSDAIGQYLATNQITFQEFVKWLSVGSKQQKHILRKEKFFKLLSSVLPSRSPQSCYKYVTRNFNSLNHQGSWSAQQVDRLKSLVQKYGRKWTLISKQLGRTSDNVYDKFRSLGEEEMQEKAKGLWKLNELITLLLQIQRQTQVQFIDHNIKKELLKETQHNAIQQKQLKQHKYNSKLFTFHNIQVIRKYIDAKLLQQININTLRWKRMAKEVSTKSVFDCRNKFVQILQVLFRNNKTLDEALVDFLQKQKAAFQSQLNWRKWNAQEFTPQQAKNRFMILKKLVEGRNTKPFKKIYQQIIAKIKNTLARQEKQK